MEDKSREAEVNTAIMTTLTTSSMKRNKLRKLVCNKFCVGGELGSECGLEFVRVLGLPASKAGTRHT